MFTLGLAYFLYRVQFPYIDNFRTFARVHTHDWPGLIALVFGDANEYRPLYYLIVKAVYDLGGGPNLVLFRSLHLLLLLLLSILYTSFVRPKTFYEYLAFCIGFACLYGLHTSRFLLLGIPLNMKLIVVILTLVAVRLLYVRPSRLGDAVVILMSCFAMFLHEMGIAVAAVFFAGYALRFRGVTRRAIAGILVCLVAYVAVRMSLSAQPVPDTFYTETGFGFRTLTVGEQAELFGGAPVLFYLYNIASTGLTVLFSEPREGEFRFLARLLDGGPHGWQWINVLTSAISTLVIGAVALGKRWDGHERRLFVIACWLFALNSGLSFLYTRDRIPTLAGVCYAFVVFAAARHAVAWLRDRRRGRPAVVMASVLLGAVICGWSLRAGGAFLWLRDSAWEVREEWTVRLDSLAQGHDDGSPAAEATAALRDALRRRVVAQPPVHPCDGATVWRLLFERQDC